MFTVDVLPAERGDSLWITYGEPDNLHHVLVDGGPVETLASLELDLERRLKDVPGGANRIELLVITHIDADHIQGIVTLLSEPSRPKLFKDIWFNGYEHLEEGALGSLDGERLTRILDANRGRWNKAFGGHAVVVPDSGPLPTRQLSGGLTITLLSPTPAGLSALRPVWEKECKANGLVAGHGADVPKSRQRSGVLGFDPDTLAKKPFRKDTSKPNLSSIAFLATYGSDSVLFGADAYAHVLAASLDRIGPGPHRLAAVKLPHHGSKGNTDLALLGRIRSPRWIVSTNGAKFHHPDPEALARVITTQQRPTFHVNYLSDEVQDLIDSAGPGWKVAKPRIVDGVSAGVTVTIS